ncbi:MAG TPA: hypothetical protein VGK74_29200 [Symbiobacteriaceae bacterium]|jgi:hypothetical protein
MEMTWQKTDPTMRLTDAARAVAPFRCSLEEAQAWCNFLVLRPEVLPAGCTLTQAVLRPEQPPGRPAGLDPAAYGWPGQGEANYATVRCVMEGPGRRLRLKQFLYDYDLVPAAGIANLWGQGQVVLHPGPETPAFTGRDYKELVGACAERFRTTVELRVEAGTFEPSELAAVLHGLTPAVPAAEPVITGASWMDLSYFRRYRLGHEAVPLGYFNFRRKLGDEPRRPASPAEAQELLGAAPPAAPPGFRLDGVAVCQAASYQEAEVHYYDGKHRRIGLLLIKPALDRQPERSPRHPADWYAGGYAEGVSSREFWWSPVHDVMAGAFGLPGVTKAELLLLRRA